MVAQLLPTWQPSARSRLLLRIGAVIGAVVLALWLAAFLSANYSGVELSGTRPYTWHNESAIFLHNSFEQPTTCSVTPTAGSRLTFDLAASSFNTNLAINGAHIDRWFSGDATVTCENPGVYLSKGPLLWIYPIGANEAIPFGAFLLVAALWAFGRRKRSSDSR